MISLLIRALGERGRLVVLDNFESWLGGGAGGNAEAATQLVALIRERLQRERAGDTAPGVDMLPISDRGALLERASGITAGHWREFLACHLGAPSAPPVSLSNEARFLTQVSEPGSDLLSVRSSVLLRGYHLRTRISPSPCLCSLRALAPHQVPPARRQGRSRR